MKYRYYPIYSFLQVQPSEMDTHASPESNRHIYSSHIQKKNSIRAIDSSKVQNIENQLCEEYVFMFCFFLDITVNKFLILLLCRLIFMSTIHHPLRRKLLILSTIQQWSEKLRANVFIYLLQTRLKFICQNLAYT